MKKGVSPLIAGVLYLAISIAAVTLVVQIGTPTLIEMKEIAAIDQAKDALVNLDKVIQEVASEGKGSARVISMQFKEGELTISSSKDQISYEIDTTSGVVSPSTQKQLGNLWFGIGANTRVFEATVDGVDSYVMENEHLNVSIRKVGNRTSPQPMNTSALINKIIHIDQGQTLDATLTISIDDDTTQENGTGYTYARETGIDLSSGRIIAHITTNAGSSYDVYFTLGSGQDFIAIEVKNYVVS